MSANGAIAQMGERVNGIHEVGGSIPPGSTSLRSLRELRLGKPLLPNVTREASEGCRAEVPKERRRATPYILQNADARELRLGKPLLPNVTREASEGWGK